MIEISEILGQHGLLNELQGGEGNGKKPRLNVEAVATCVSGCWGKSRVKLVPKSSIFCPDCGYALFWKLRPKKN